MNSAWEGLSVHLATSLLTEISIFQRLKYGYSSQKGSSEMNAKSFLSGNVISKKGKTVLKLFDGGTLVLAMGNL